MKSALTSPKTTVLGVLTIAGALIHAGTQYYSGLAVDVPTLFAGLTAGFGLIHAADSKPAENK